MRKQKAVFLDRDGVLNQAVLCDGKPYPPCSAEELVVLPETVDALKSLKNAGFLLIGATNQPDVARGRTTKEIVENMHAILMQKLPLDAMNVCYHDDQHQCACRKPLPGLLLGAVKQFEIDFSESFMIGDRWKDMEAGKRAGCKTIFIDYGYAEKQPESCDYRVSSLREASKIILGDCT